MIGNFYNKLYSYLYKVDKKQPVYYTFNNKNKAENTMDNWLIPALAIVVGLIEGFLITFIFAKLPEKWLQDYGYDPKAPDFRLSKRMKIFPHGLISALFLSAAYLFTVVYSYDFFFTNHSFLRLVSLIIVLPIIIMIAMSDRLNRIIPDEFSIALFLTGFLEYGADLARCAVWFSPYVPWYYPLISRVVAGILGFGVLWLIGFITVTFFGKEGMGQGDMKLLGACGFLTGLHGLILVVYIGIIMAAVFAVPMFVMKRIRIYKENKMIRESADPVAARRELMKKKAAMHFADDPDYLAFGPFLAIGAAIFLVLEPVFYENLCGIFMAMGSYR